MKKVFNKQRNAKVLSKEGNDVIVSINSKDFLFTQSTIISSVQLEGGSHLIHPKTSKFVNANGDCWSNESCKANYKSFVGAWNYVNHVQEPEKSVGFIADAILRKKYLTSKKDVSVYYADILIGTHRDHKDLCSKIARGDISFMSMGCEVMKSTCSKCGNVTEDEVDNYCSCLTNNKGNYYVDSYGTKRRVAEILGDDTAGSVNFIEASWLSEPPAFHGAVKSNLFRIPKDFSVEVKVPETSLERGAFSKYFV